MNKILKKNFPNDIVNNTQDEILEDTLKLDDPRIWIWLSSAENQGFMNEDFVDFFTI